MKLTAAETALVLRERERLALDSRDWAKEPFATTRQLIVMSWWTAEQFTERRWRWDPAAQVMRNVEHQDNVSETRI
mgnify:FL=1